MQLINKETTRKEKYPSDQIKPYSSTSCPKDTNEVNYDAVSVNSKTIIEIPPSKPPLFELRTYPQAWIALFLLVLLRTAVSVFQFTFSVVPGITSEYFNVSLSAVNWLANIQCIIYVIMSFFTGFIFEKLGVKRSVRNNKLY